MFSSDLGEGPEDFLERYKKGLTNLVNAVDPTHTLHLDLLTLQARMHENIDASRLFGDDETKRSDRNRLLYQLNGLSKRVLGTSFNALCGIGAVSTFIDPATVSPSAVLPVAAWPRMLEIDTDYAARRDRLIKAIINNDYEEATAQYWYLIYYTGTRELWLDNAYLTERLLELAAKHKDHKTVGLLQARGKAWPFMYKGQFRKARPLLAEAYKSLSKAKAKAELGIFYEYTGDIYAQMGDLARATDSYDEARRKLRDMAAHKVDLKSRFAQARSQALSSRTRIGALTRLSDEYNLIKSYREGIVQMELSRSYYSGQAPEAIAMAESAYNLLSNNVRMPTPAARAERLLHRMMRGQPIEHLFGPSKRGGHV